MHWTQHTMFDVVETDTFDDWHISMSQNSNQTCNFCLFVSSDEFEWIVTFQPESIELMLI